MTKFPLQLTILNTCSSCRFSARQLQIRKLSIRRQIPPQRRQWPFPRSTPNKLSIDGCGAVRLLSDNSFDLLQPAQVRHFSTRRAQRERKDVSEDEDLSGTQRKRSSIEKEHDLLDNLQVVWENGSNRVDRKEAALEQEPEAILEEEDTREEHSPIDRHDLTPEEVAMGARRYFGDHLPEGALSEEELRIYERLYGKALKIDPNAEREEDIEDALLRESEDGSLEEVELLEDEVTDDFEEEIPEELMHGTKSKPKRARDMSLADQQLQRDIQEALDAQVAAQAPTGTSEQSVDEDLIEEDAEAEDETTRSHPFTAANRFATNPKTLQLPKESLVDPISAMISNVSNKHLDEYAHKSFGGPGLPYATGTPLVSRTMTQKPIPLTASQNKISAIGADAFLVSLYPGTFAAVTSMLVETRKRLGSEWIRGLLQKEGGPRILDADGGGASVLAWREILRAEWGLMHESLSEDEILPTPMGKATVVTGSDELRHRASGLLENTTFLPRLPDYVHTSFPLGGPRKQFDVIVAPYSLWQLQEQWERRQKVQNLWSLLNPAGGVLVLMEKGVPRGFETLADARDYILTDLFDNTSSTTTDNTIADEPTTADNADTSLSVLRRAPGRIVAPCPHHAPCPMYTVPGVSRQRKDYCRFTQRYIRPPTYQRMLGARDRNHEDVEFSYVVVQKGVPPAPAAENVEAGEAATTRAFEGYDVDDADLPHGEDGDGGPPLPRAPLPRQVLPPLKRHGHAVLDVCTPAGRLERWTVTRGYGQVPYRDARKARWGDLWALGAKLRVEKRVRLGRPEGSRGVKKLTGREKARARRREAKGRFGEGVAAPGEVG